MTSRELADQIIEVLKGAGPQTSKRILAALNATLHFLETLPAAENVTGVPPVRGAVKAAPPAFTDLANELDTAINVRISPMDSDSKIERINAERLKVMQRVADRLRSA